MKEKYTVIAPVEVVIDGSFCHIFCDFLVARYCSLYHRDLECDENLGEIFRCAECREAVASVSSDAEIALVSEDSFSLKMFGEEFKFRFNTKILNDKLRMTPAEFVEHCKVLAKREGVNVLDFINAQGFMLIGGSRKRFNAVCDRVFETKLKGRWLADGYKIDGNLLTVTSDRVYNKNYTTTLRWDLPIVRLPSSNTELMKIDKVAKLKKGDVLSRYEVRELMDAVKSVPDGQWNVARILWKSGKSKNTQISDLGREPYVEDMWERDDELWVKTSSGVYVFPLEDITAESLMEILNHCYNEVEFNEMASKYQAKSDNL